MTFQEKQENARKRISNLQIELQHARRELETLQTNGVIAALQSAGWQSNLSEFERIGSKSRWSDFIVADAIAVLRVGEALFVIDGLVEKHSLTGAVRWCEKQYYQSPFRFVYIHLFDDADDAIAAKSEIREILGL